MQEHGSNSGQLGGLAIGPDTGRLSWPNEALANIGWGLVSRWMNKGRKTPECDQPTLPIALEAMSSTFVRGHASIILIVVNRDDTQ